MMHILFGSLERFTSVLRELNKLCAMHIARCVMSDKEWSLAQKDGRDPFIDIGGIRCEKFYGPLQSYDHQYTASRYAAWPGIFLLPCLSVASTFGFSG